MWLLVNHTKTSKHFTLKLISFNSGQLQNNTVDSAMLMLITINRVIIIKSTTTLLLLLSLLLLLLLLLLLFLFCVKSLNR